MVFSHSSQDEQRPSVTSAVSSITVPDATLIPLLHQPGEHSHNASLFIFPNSLSGLVTGVWNTFVLAYLPLSA
ncbi:hypothetical protein BDR03DRAFT_292713 [Suillus americanus]|nr:hypothetical protein BDR03DRAFT_292713 [Suillus americanus]